MIQETFIRELESIVGKSHVSCTNTGIELYSYDASLVTGNPGVVVFPADTREVSLVVKAANNAGVDFIPRGFGTNLSGGTISVTKGLVICLSRFNKILEIHPESRYAVVQPGVTNLELQQTLAKVGAFYAPDPASQKVSTLGGNAGENSGGPLCLKYGVTSNHILGMEMVMTDGEILRIGGPALDPPGLDLRGVIIGSEGGFGIITELTLRTLPKTESVITMLAVYDDLQSAALSVSKIISAGIVPNTLEMMDATVIEAVEANASCGYPTDAAAVLIIEVEGMIKGLKEQAVRIEEICMDTNCRNISTAKTREERDRLWQGRRGAFGAIARLAPNYLVNDACVPRTLLPRALEKVKAISGDYGFRVGNVFHAGDGNLHPLLLFDSRNPKEREQVHKAGWDIMAACAELGGTISGEHGIGKEKQAAMHMVFSGDDLNTQQAVKNAFDPKNILNPDKVIPVSDPPGNQLPPTAPTILKRAGGASAKGVSDAMAAIKQAQDKKVPVTIIGAGTSGNCGNHITKETTSISTAAMTEIIEFDPSNQFITAGAGVTLKELREILAKENQWLPLRPPYFTDQATVGALAAMGSSGPERMLYGAPRDVILGLQYIDSKGRIISTGGKVVKNVAGYDMTRLMVGSGGNLGMITEITWRVSTRPECCMAAAASGTQETCMKAALELMNDNLTPAFITALPDGNQHGTLTLMAGFEGLSRVVEHQAEKCGQLFESAGLTLLGAEEYDLLNGCFKERFKTMANHPFTVKAAGTARSTPDVLQAVTKECKTADWLLDIGCGRVFAGLDTLDTPSWSVMNHAIRTAGGHIQLDKAPDAFKKENDIYGTSPRPEWDLMHTLKQALDPAGLFTPGGLPGRAAKTV